MSPSKIRNLVSVKDRIRKELALGEEVVTIRRNAPAALLYEDALKENKTRISASGALIAFSGSKTGRSPKDKRIVDEPTSCLLYTSRCV